jgi:hypothetical protein
MTPGGGGFLVCVGAALLAGAVLPWSFGGPVVIAGFVVGTAVIVGVSIAGRMRGLPKPRTRDIVVVWIAVAFEAAAFFFLFPYLTGDPRTQMIGVIAIVGVHFLPMAWSFGPLIAWLGLACICVAAAGQLAPTIPTPALIAADGFLKIAFGLAMFAALFRTPPSASLS